MSAILPEPSSPLKHQTRRAARRLSRAHLLVLLSMAVLMIGYGCVSPERPYGTGPADGGAGQGGSGGGGGGGGGLPNGQPCTDAASCGSGACVDGVCCENACTGTCMACASGFTGVADGTCAPVQPNTDPKNQCADDGGPSCGKNGSCDGKGACAFYPAGMECAPQTCTGQTKTLAKQCDGMGTCADQGTVDCAPFQCTGNACASDCQSDSDCGANEYCEAGTGACLPKKPVGTACLPNKPNQCDTGFCADGFCCNAACDGVCESCSAALTGGMDGTCAASTAGTDPDGECVDQGAPSCGTDGTCNGAKACRRYGAGTVCVAGSCANGVQTNPDTCDGSGACVDNGTVSCGAFSCMGAVCANMCTIDAQCAAGQYCAAGACVPKKTGGAACGGANECATGFCVDGVCCDAACGGTCNACSTAKKGGGPNGVCGPIASGTDPDSECNDQGAMSCGTTGVCSGASSCQQYPAGTICAPQSCTGSTQTNTDTCNGMGTCVDGGSSSCAPYICGAAACKTTCASDADCTAGNSCAGGVCGTKKPLGSACGANADCLSGFCVDGVCCDTACSGTCQACSAAKKGGGATSGTCGPILVGTDPDNECATQAASTCGTTGACGGGASCQLYPTGTVCVAASCSAGVESKADTCNGTGMCVDAGTVMCSPYACGATTCKTSCAADADCGSGNYCSAMACVAKKANGQACSGANQCSSGNCVDGVCCNTACAGACFACTGAKKGAGLDGTCDPIKSGLDPDNECADQGPMTCGTNGFCSGMGACSFYPSGTVCAASSCSMGIETKADTCNGTGMCVDSGTVSCDPYSCGASSCLSSCAVNADCAGTHYCSAGSCVPKLLNGVACSATGQCKSGFCVEGVCCDTACTAGCDSCLAMYTFGTDGVCGPIDCADPKNFCIGTKLCILGACGGSICP